MLHSVPNSFAAAINASCAPKLVVSAALGKIYQSVSVLTNICVPLIIVLQATGHRRNLFRHTCPPPPPRQDRARQSRPPQAQHQSRQQSPPLPRQLCRRAPAPQPRGHHRPWLLSQSTIARPVNYLNQILACKLF